MVEAAVAVLDNPALGQRVSRPAEGHVVGMDIADVKAGDIGADGGGEGDGVAPFAYDVVCRAAERTDGGIVGGVGGEAADGGGTCGDGVDAVDATTIPYMDLPSRFGSDGGPVEGGGGVGDSGDGQAVGRQTWHAVGDEGTDGPLAVAEAVGVAVLTHAEGVVGGGLQAVEGVGVAGDGDVGGGPVGGHGLLHVNLVDGAVAGPGGGGGLVGVSDACDSGLVTDSTTAGDEL